MQYCSKCRTLFEHETTCSHCNEALAEPKQGNLVLLTAAMQAQSNEILDAFRARGIVIERSPTIEEGVFELFVQYADWEVANKTLNIVLEDLRKHALYQNEENTAENKQKPKVNQGRKWALRIAVAAAFALAVWGVVALTDIAMGFVKGWFS